MGFFQSHDDPGDSNADEGLSAAAKLSTQALHDLKEAPVRKARSEIFDISM